MNVVVDLLEHLCSPEMGTAMGFGIKRYDSDSFRQVADNECLMEKGVTMCTHLCGELALIHHIYQTPPYLFLLLVDPDDNVVQACLRNCEAAFEAYQMLEIDAGFNRDAADYLQSLGVGDDQWVVELFIMLFEVDFRVVTDEIVAEVERYKRSHMNEVIVEYFHQRR